MGSFTGLVVRELVSNTLGDFSYYSRDEMFLHLVRVREGTGSLTRLGVLQFVKTEILPSVSPQCWSHQHVLTYLTSLGSEMRTQVLCLSRRLFSTIFDFLKPLSYCLNVTIDILLKATIL